MEKMAAGCDKFFGDSWHLLASVLTIIAYYQKINTLIGEMVLSGSKYSNMF